MRHLLPLSVLALFTSLSAAACSDASSSPPGSPSSTTQDPSKPQEASSALSRNTSPNVPSADTTALVTGDTQLAVDLYKTVGKSTDFAGQNLFFSPHSISVALAMTYAGARGTTATEMANALHFTLPQASLHNAMNGLDLALSSRGQNAKGDDGAAFRLRVTNSLWGLPKMPFEQPFLDTLATNYGAGIRLTDFVGNPEGSRTAINTWVADETEQRIKELLAQGSIDAQTRMVLVNAVYFNAAWAQANTFDAGATKAAAFHAPGGDVTADFMAQTSSLSHLRGDGFDAVALPYDGQELDMIAIAPDAGTFDAFESTLDASKLGTIVSTMTDENVELHMPKFKIEGKSFSVRDALKALGMTSAFDMGTADFSGMLAPSADHLFIGDVVHQAFVSVDENGTEAAAATAVEMAGNAMPQEPTPVRLDRPFIFAIRDRATGAFVFLGRVMHP